jgi:two-component system sensor histidine kinase PilS (NtrC family)
MSKNKLVPSPANADWRLLRVYIHYRVFLAILLLGLYTVPTSKGLVGDANGLLFLLTSVIYLTVTIWGLILTRQPEQDLTFSALFRLVIDLIALTLMLHASGGLNPQFATLFMVAVAAGNILLSGRLGAMVAAVAAFAIIYEQFYYAVSEEDGFSPRTLAQASLLGVGFFAVALFSQMISRRMRQSEALAASRAEDIVGLQTLNAQIIQRMRTGIVVVDERRNILLINDAARLLLGIDQPRQWSQPLLEVSPLLDAGVLAWRHNTNLLRPLAFRNSDTAATLSATFAALGDDPRSREVLIFMEDTAQLVQQAQQLKLASLGRLTASIAHEVRNPLGAISHATQLLAESPAIITGPDKRLLDIIQQHCLRMNSIVENILQLSRRQSSTPEPILLEQWLRTFAEEFNSGRPDPALISIYCGETELAISFDARQLYQIVANLVTNGLRYSLKQMGREEIRLIAGVLPLEELPYLDIIDSGPGIPESALEHLFEPFFTTESGGTGLGLYLSRELCESNQARLDYLSTERGGACFRITFAHPGRMG